jgi:hypothetical protein
VSSAISCSCQTIKDQNQWCGRIYGKTKSETDSWRMSRSKQMSACASEKRPV